VNERNFREEPLLNDFSREVNNPSNSSNPQPMVITNNNIDEHQEVEESLSIMDAEKELIIKALKKHRGKRRDASGDLGISERTLYRKLKEYNINE
jgi:transcriptional regulator of acetoin/glycerol metabolism